MRTTPDTARQALLQSMRAKRLCTGHEHVAGALAACGITHVFGVNGTPIDGILAACVHVGLRVIGARHQQGAALMSLAHNYVAGRLCSAVVVSPGPGAMNAATGLLYGHDNRWPLLVIGARRALAFPSGFQDFDGARCFAPVTKATVCVDSIETLATALHEAFGTASSSPPGPVYVEVSPQALNASVDTRSAAPWQAPSRAQLLRGTEGAEPDAARLAEAVALLAQARRPVLLVGKGARWSEPTPLLLHLADTFGMAFAASPMGRGLLPDDHPMCFTAVRARMLADADLVLMVGARLDWTFRYGIEISPQARMVRVDADPAEAAQVLGRGVALHGDAGQVLQRLLDGLAAHQLAGQWVGPDRAWHAALAAERASRGIGVVPVSERGLLPMSPYEWLGELGRALPQDAITVLDGNIVMAAAQQMLPVRHPASRLGPGSNGCMGVGIPFAIGAKLARPDLPVVAIVGDFGFGLNAFELETAVRHRVPVVVVVANNAGAGGATRQHKFLGGHPERIYQFGAGIRHDLLMQALGGTGVRVERPGELGAAVAGALAAAQVACIDIVTSENTALASTL